MFLQTSGDILNIVLAFSILWLVVLLSVLLWGAISVVFSARKMVRDVEEKIRAIESVITLAREKLDSTADYLGALVTVVRDGMEWFRDRESRAPKKKRAKR